MAKWAGNIGFTETVEVEPGVWEEQITERPYFGDVVVNRWSRQNSGNVNDNVKINNQISIVSDPYADSNFYSIRYVEFMGAKWTVSNFEVQYPRLILTIGGLYNGQTTTTDEP